MLQNESQFFRLKRNPIRFEEFLTLGHAHCLGESRKPEAFYLFGSSLPNRCSRDAAASGSASESIRETKPREEFSKK
jgi:hypothetical protein